MNNDKRGVGRHDYKAEVFHINHNNKDIMSSVFFL